MLDLLQQRDAQRQTERLMEWQRARERLEEVLHRHLPGQRVWLFGSLLEPGRFNAASDIDLAEAFENNIDDERGWHAEPIHRLSITVPGVRPAVYRPAILPALRDLRGFRQIVTHAYDLQLDSERFAIVLRHAESAAALLPGTAAAFFDAVTKELESDII